MAWLWMLLACALVALLLAVIVLRANRTDTVKPYGELRRDLIARADANAPLPEAPVRPAGLDTRLSTDVRSELASLWPPTDESWSRYFTAYSRIVASIEAELRAIDADRDWYELLSPDRRAVVLIDQCENEINNGGFDQYFLNSSGDGASMLPDAARRIGSPDLVTLAERALAQFPAGQPARHREQRLVQMDALPESARHAWNELDNAYFALNLPFGGVAAYLGGKHILEHPQEFFKP